MNRQEIEVLLNLLPSFSFMAGSIIFGVIGYIVYKQGKKNKLLFLKLLGVVFMFYPCIISDTVMMCVVGVSLCLTLYTYLNY